jgi:tRNA A58 N-methylase Trm61
MTKLVPAPNGWLCPNDPGEPGKNAPRWSVNDVEAKLVSEILAGRRVLEVGTGLGVATHKIAEKSEVYTVDIDPWVKKTVAPDLPKNVRFFDNIKDVPRPLDGAFIDGRHTYEDCLRDIKDAMEIVPDGVFVFHDTKMNTVYSAIRDSGLEFVMVHTIAGMAIAWRKA